MLVFVHGWGFDRTIWDPLRRALAGRPGAAIDLGYFGEPMLAMPEGPVVAVGHSFGALWLLRNRPAELRGFVAVNGFDRFPLSRRIVDRMLARFSAQPLAVLTEFRRRCGADAPPDGIDAGRLAADLVLLRDEDERAAATALGCPILSLESEADPILDGPGFSGAPVEQAVLAGHGHLLPLTAPDWCAARIGEWL
jgi:pimeloyl-[acyl-carrier protein] methyl ester esterase